MAGFNQRRSLLADGENLPAEFLNRHDWDLRGVPHREFVTVPVVVRCAVAAYLNGVRIAAGPKTPQPLPPGEVARGFPTSPDGEFDLSDSISLLKNGENLLALEGPFTSEAYNALPITACLLANFTRGPF